MQQFKIGTTPGLYGIARPADLASALRKIGFGVTKGVEVLESILDVPHEISFTEGKEIRELAEKMGIEVLIHGALDTPLTYGDLEMWRRTQDTLRRSFISAIYCGSSYVLFHACGGERWPETVTAAELPVAFRMVDWDGRLLSELLYEEAELREWFVEKYGRAYAGVILTPEEAERITIMMRRFDIEELEPRRREWEEKKLPREERERREAEEIERKYSELIARVLREHLSQEKPEKRKWMHEERGSPVDVYRIVAQYLCMKREPLVEEFEKMYEKELKDAGLVLPIPTGRKEVEDWLETLLRKMKEPGRKVLGDFYHGLVASKYLEGHLRALGRELKRFVEKGIPALPISEEEKRELEKIAKEIKLTIETPFLGGAYAGMMTLWHPRQIYAAVKTVREKFAKDPELKEFGEKIFMTIDFEHIAVEGVDPYAEIPEFAKLAPDAGKYIISLHVTKPHPLHHHIEVEPGDVDVYRLLWALRQAGLGRYFTVYLIFERGGEAEPYKRSITALKIMADFLSREVRPEELIRYPEFFGVAAGEIASLEKQRPIIKAHAFDPLKGMLAVPEEEWTFLGRIARERGKLEEWRREELK